jgi:hypothetical protein
MYPSLNNSGTNLRCTPVSLSLSCQSQYLWHESHYLRHESHYLWHATVGARSLCSCDAHLLWSIVPYRSTHKQIDQRKTVRDRKPGMVRWCNYAGPAAASLCHRWMGVDAMIEGLLVSAIGDLSRRTVKGRGCTQHLTIRPRRNQSLFPCLRRGIYPDSTRGNPPIPVTARNP